MKAYQVIIVCVICPSPPPLSHQRYHPREYYEANLELKLAIDQIHNGFFCPEHPDLFHDLTYHLLNHDTYVVCCNNGLRECGTFLCPLPPPSLLPPQILLGIVCWLTMQHTSSVKSRCPLRMRYVVDESLCTHTCSDSCHMHTHTCIHTQWFMSHAQ